MTGVVVWFTGLPSSGKSKLARAVHQRLLQAGQPCCLLDGDVVRQLLFPELGYTEAERASFYAKLAALAGELARQELAVLVPATAPLGEQRLNARQLAPRFIEVWVTTPLEECQRRDAKGLYAAARAGESSSLPGVGQAYEPPSKADVLASGGEDLAAAQTIAALCCQEGAGQ